MVSNCPTLKSSTEKKGFGRWTLVCKFFIGDTGTRKEKGVTVMSGSIGPSWSTKQGYSMNPYNNITGYRYGWRRRIHVEFAHRVIPVYDPFP